MILTRHTLLSFLALTGAGVVLVGSVMAETPDPATRQSWDVTGRFVLHQKLAPVGGRHRVAHEFVYDPIAGATIPQRFMRDGQSHSAPPSNLSASDGEPVHTADGLTPAETPLARRDGTNPAEHAAAPLLDPRRAFTESALPDRRTQRERRLDYRAVFDPSIVPFKRNHALNTVDGDYRLELIRGHVRQLQVIGNRVDPGREVFWGSVLVNGERGRLIPLPSVSPDSQVLSYSTTPRANVTFHKDSADNLYVRPEKSGAFAWSS